LGEEFEKDDPHLEDGDKGEDGILVRVLDFKTSSLSLYMDITSFQR
jgi:hypothetical protein